MKMEEACRFPFSPVSPFFFRPHQFYVRTFICPASLLPARPIFNSAFALICLVIGVSPAGLHCATARPYFPLCFLDMDDLPGAVEQ